jgi:hypothetical protein
MPRGSEITQRRNRHRGVQELFAGLPLTPLGRTVKEPRLRIVGTSGE